MCSGCLGVTTHSIRHYHKQQSTRALRHELKQRLVRARAITDRLFASLRPNAFYERPIAERHRLIFYLGHLETFDWNLLCHRLAGLPSHSREFERLFALGIDPTLGAEPQDSRDSWPTLHVVRLWNALLRQQVNRVIDELPFEGWLERGCALQACIEHRLMHAETLCYLLHRLPFSAKKLGLAPTRIAALEPSNDWIVIPSGEATLGAPKNAGGFVWDNECDEHRHWVPKFRVQRYPVTNGDFLNFVEAGGYQERSFWRPADWAWRERAGIEHPSFWERSTTGWQWRAMFTRVPLPLAWPVYVSHAEASAYARFIQKRLLSEAEWHRAASGISNTTQVRAYDPGPVDALPETQSAYGVHGLVGNGWNWTSSVFAPFPNFAAEPFYPGHSANFFDGRHFVLKGGSPCTDRSLMRQSFRNWLPSHYPYAYATFRCAEGE